MKLIAILVWGLKLISQILAQEDFVASSSTTSSPDQSSFYTAAVVEMYSPGNDLSDPEDVVEVNLADYVQLVYQASSKGADILVFPEATLNYFGIDSYENLTETAVDISMEVPSSTSDCLYTQNVILEELSFAASNASIYLLVNLVEKEPCDDTDKSCKNGFKLFNTNVVFDRSGCIISRYRKFNLFWEPFMTKPETPEHATFETDFGVTFGHVVCFDLMFKSPLVDLIDSGISHILYPTAWFQETPSLSANQIQQGFAQSKNVILLAAGANWPDHSNTGSGIFVGRHGAVEKIISYQKETRLLIAEVPKDVNDPEFVAKEPSIEPYSATEMDSLLIFNHFDWPTTELSDHEEMTMEQVVCEFRLNYTQQDSTDGYSYRLLTFNGLRPYLNITTGGEAHCSIVSCLGDANCGQKFGDKISSVKFHEIEISMTITGGIEDFNVMPSTLDNSVNVMSAKLYNFTEEIDGNVHKFTIKSSDVPQSMLTFGIYARHFSLDGQPLPVEYIEHGDEFADCTNDKEDSVHAIIAIDDSDDNDFALKMTIYVLLMVFLSIITAIMTYKKLQTPYIKASSMNKRKSVNFA